MKTTLVLTIVILTTVGHAANAAGFDSPGYSDISVISVTPKAGSIKPFVMAVFTKEQRQRVAAAASRKRAQIK